jgi:transcriptional regulator with GAF, ATPase, and Fis domain
MPTLKYHPPEGGPREYSVHKAVTTLGRSLDNDVPLREPGVLEHHAQIMFDGRDFSLEELDRNAEILINGKKKRRARLCHGDRLQLGSAQVSFSIFADATGVIETPGNRSGGASELPGIRKLQEFSDKLMNKGSIDELLDAMLADVLDLTGADKGVVLLTVPGENVGADKKIAVRAWRNVARESIADGGGGVSDSIVRTVLSTAKPVIVSDALADTIFGKSESVVALQLSSVMCAPMLSQGEAIGALYVGNDKVKHLFERPQLDLLTIYAAQASLILQNAMLVNDLKADKEKLAAELFDKRFGEIIGSCASMMEVFRKLQKVATTDISVLITGETGTGKELIAKELHRRSQRAAGPFVTINCGAIPENLIESELFGHVKGAFTGAVANRAGKFQAADGGTLFLDEIGELPPALQVKLLRALQEKIVFRVGDSRAEKVDIRIVAATNKVLEDEIKQGTFREDLYYRLNVVNLWLPPLRERGDDVVIIAKALLAKFADEMKSPVKGLSPSAFGAIRKYAWPGNIRQLENRLKKAIVLCDRTLLSAEDLDLGPEAQEPLLPLEKAKEEFQRRYVLDALEKNNGNRTQTARELGVDPRTIFRYLEKEPNAMPSGGGGEAG